MSAPQKLNQKQIVDQAIVLLREQGLDGVTLRSLADRLHVEAASLYRHVGNKQRLLALATMELFRWQLEQIGPCSDWSDWLHRFGRTLWKTQSEFPDCARLVLSTRFEAADYEAMSDLATAPLKNFGVTPGLAQQMHISIQAMVLGMASLADGPNSQCVRDTVAVDDLLDHALSTMINGWKIENAALAGG